MANLKNVNITDGSGLTIPKGTTAQRPSAPEEGFLRYNTDLLRLEYYNGIDWIFVDESLFETQFPLDGLQIFLDGSDLLDASSNLWLNRANPKLSASIKTDCNSAPLGGIEFNGAANSSAQISFDTAIDYSLGQTIVMWIRPEEDGASIRRNPYDQAYGGPGTLTYETANTINYYWGTSGLNDHPYTSINSGFTVLGEELAFICCSRDQASDVAKWYKNGELVTTGTAGGYAATANTTNRLLLGDGYATATANGGRYLGNIFFVMVYDRQLSDAEVLQIYNLTKDRYNG